MSEKKLNPKLETIKAKYKNGIPQDVIESVAERLAVLYKGE
jgi:hypothetical protein